MPIAKIEMLAGRSDSTKAEIAKEITATLARHTGASPEHIYVMFSDIEANNWAVSGETFAHKKAQQESLS